MPNVTQSLCREMIRLGAASDANKMGADELQEYAHHCATIAIGRGTYGINCGLFINHKTGQIVAAASRSSALFILV